jgi:hypothetical protein
MQWHMPNGVGRSFWTLPRELPDVRRFGLGGIHEGGWRSEPCSPAPAPQHSQLFKAPLEIHARIRERAAENNGSRCAIGCDGECLDTEDSPDVLKRVATLILMRTDSP